MIGIPGELIRLAQYPFRIMTRLSTGVFKREPSDVFQIAPAAEGVEKLGQGLFALATDGEVNVRSVECSLCVIRGKISAPNNRHLRETGAYFTAAFNRAAGLGTGHYSDRQEFDRRGLYESVKGLQRPRVEVSIDNAVLLATLQNRGYRKGRKG
jgi:hypothetical protein